MSRFNIKADDARVTIAVGKDHAFGYFAQVWTNAEHPDSCECEQCEYDKPAHEGNDLSGWTGVIAFVRQSIGIDITEQIVGVGAG